MQVWVVHGGTVFATREEYLSYLRNKEIDPTKFDYRDWKSRLQESLGSAFKVLAPSMPNKQNASYDDWKIWFGRHIEFMDPPIVLVGHSLGAIFLAKYLSEEDFPKKILATFLVSGPYHEDLSRPIPGFELGSLEKLSKQGGAIHLYHSKDDKVVPFAELSKYQAQLPQAKAHVFEDRGHFNQEQFPELVDEIKKLA